jgi:hypothetical protein
VTPIKRGEHVFAGALAAASAAAESGLPKLSRFSIGDFVDDAAAPARAPIRAGGHCAALPTLPPKPEAAPALRVALELDEESGAVKLCLGPSEGDCTPAPDEAADLARLQRLGCTRLSAAAQAGSYLGFNSALLEHMRAASKKTMSTAAVRSWLRRPEQAEFLEKLLAAHGVEQLAGLQIDHVIARTWGGVDHPWNYFVMPSRLNASFNSDVSNEKIVRCDPERQPFELRCDPPSPHRFMGRRVARSVKAFVDFIRCQVEFSIDLNGFDPVKAGIV